MLNLVLHVPNFSCNLFSVSKYAKDYHCVVVVVFGLKNIFYFSFSKNNFHFLYFLFLKIRLVTKSENCC